MWEHAVRRGRMLNWHEDWGMKEVAKGSTSQ